MRLVWRWSREGFTTTRRHAHSQASESPARGSKHAYPRRVRETADRGRHVRAASAECGLPRPPRCPGPTYTDGSHAENLPPCVLHFTRPSARGYRPGTGVRLATVRLSRRDAVSQPAPGCRKRSTYKDAGRAENLRTAVFTSPARGDAKMQNRGRVLKSSRFAGRPRTGPAPGG